MTSTRTNWIALVFFVAAATLLSGLFRPSVGGLIAPAGLSPATLLALIALFVGWGPALAAHISWGLFGPQGRRSTIGGTWHIGATLQAAIPPLVFGAFGYPNSFGLEPHLAGSLFGGLLVFYALGEEIGWRGYMQDALSPRPIWLRALIIAPAWFLWHLWFWQGTPGMAAALQGFAILLVAGFVLSSVVEETRSLASAAAFHAVGNIAAMAPIINLPPRQRLIIAAVALGAMLLVHRRWKKHLRDSRSSPG